MSDALIEQIQSPVQPVQLILENSISAPFFVPRYQRGYAWKESHVFDFIGDIEALITKLHDLPGGETADDQLHFFGAILTIERKDHGPFSRAFELVDGQQRLTTFVMTLELLRRRLLLLEKLPKAEEDGLDPTITETAKADAKDLTSVLELTVREKSGKRTIYPRLTLSKDDDPYFQLLLKDAARKPTFDSHRYLDEAAGWIDTRLIDKWLHPGDPPQTFKPREELERLSVLREALLHHCAIVHLSTPRRGLGYRLFMILNDRGEPLSVSDLLRTRTMELLQDHDTAQELAAQAWSDMRVRKDATDAFLRDVYQSRTGDRAPSTDLFDKLDSTFFGAFDIQSDKDADELVAFLQELRDEQGSHRLITAGDWPYTTGAADGWSKMRLKRLVKTLRASASVPLLLSVKKSRGEDEFLATVQYLERLAFRWAVSGAHAGTLGEALFREAKKVRDDPTYGLDAIKSALAPLVALRAADSAFKPGLGVRMRYTGSKPQLKYLLTTIDDYFPWWEGDAGGEPVCSAMGPYDLERVHLEHIYPDNPKKADVNVALEPVKQNLGNITIFVPKDNIRATNDPFGKKKAKYKKSKAFMTAALGDRTKATWSARDLSERQGQLIELALDVFRIPGSDGAHVAPATAAGSFFAQQNPGSPYADIPGVAYDFPPGIPNSSEIVPGATLVTYLSEKDSVDGRRITGVGRVGDLISGGSGMIATFDRHGEFDPPLSFEEVGGDPRNNQRNSINSMPGQALDSILEHAGVDEVSDLPEVVADLDAILTKIVGDAGPLQGGDVEESDD